MTLKASLMAALPEARRIANFLERDWAGEGVVVSLDERAAGDWSIEAYFEQGEPGELEAIIRDRLGADAFDAPLSVEVLSETDWVAAGLKALAPVLAGRFVVHGSHDRDTLPAGRVRIEIDAGQAFGSGHHGTTAGCLAMLDGLMRRRQFGKALDLGTGSGILSIALAKAARMHVLATDIDPVAVRVAAANARLNSVAHLVETRIAAGVRDATIRSRAPFDLIVANILAEPLIRMAPDVAEMLARRGVLVLSGILQRQRSRVVAAYAAQGLALRSARGFEDWSVLVLHRR